MDVNTAQRTCALLTPIEIGDTYERGVTCEATIAPSADLRFTMVSTVGMKRYQIRRPVLDPGQESISIDWDLGPVRAFTTSRTTLGLVGTIPRTLQECSAFIGKLTVLCVEGSAP